MAARPAVARDQGHANRSISVSPELKLDRKSGQDERDPGKEGSSVSVVHFAFLEGAKARRRGWAPE